MTPLPARDAFQALPHALTLLGMSGVGKTTLANKLREEDGWFHYSADYRIGTRYLAEPILDNIKRKIMEKDRFTAELLRSDSIYICHNITVDNLAPVTTFLGMYGNGEDELTLSEFKRRQDLYGRGECWSMRDVPDFIAKARGLYRCRNFVNDASGSLCEIEELYCRCVEMGAPGLFEHLTRQTLLIYVELSPEQRQVIIQRAKDYPKPLYYFPPLLAELTAGLPERADRPGREIARGWVGRLIEDRAVRYRSIAERWGLIIPVERLWGMLDRVEQEQRQASPDKGRRTGLLTPALLDLIYEAARDELDRRPEKAPILQGYLDSCAAADSAPGR
ncbi:ATPase [Azospirillum sp. RWY-5-1]|uniref:ATPase n=1 Tax=Azospirillum oleiclasticum TaxID=2735135 RepID=A0ABX2TMR2_9PROT|nr:ATPase [Azospirillum oleiclasticum]NYZ17411.1 ATPase [Azospirillum oleiclasticum]NYZ24788.1 ATPase [Azospirillum oleiclasticum]